MTYINIPTAQLEHEAFLDATDEQNGVWLKLMRYCCSTENGGRIPSVKSWSANKIMIVLRVNLEQLASTCPLWKWVGEDLLVEFYPKAKEAEVQDKRARGSRGAEKRWGQPNPNTISQCQTGNPANSGNEIPLIATSELGICGREEKRREENIMEWKGAPPADEVPPIPQTSTAGFGIEIPSDETILAFTSTWPGDHTRGIPAGIPEAWILDWIAWRRGDTKPFPRDWKSDITRRFTAAWVARRSTARNGTSTPSGTPNSPPAYQRVRQLEEALQNHPGNPDNGVGSVARKQAEFPNFQKLVDELAELKRSMHAQPSAV